MTGHKNLFNTPLVFKKNIFFSLYTGVELINNVVVVAVDSKGTQPYT